MSDHAVEKSPLKRQFEKLQELSAFLLVGTAIALIWANTDHHSYEEAFHKINFMGHYNLLHFLVNDVFMVLFFGIAMKEVSESFLPGGALSSMSKAAMPVVATMGGVFGPIGMFFVLRAVLAPEPDIFNEIGRASCRERV